MLEISSIVCFQVMRVKLLPPTTMELNAYNPILPPPSISQVMLLANPSKVSAVNKVLAKILEWPRFW